MNLVIQNTSVVWGGNEKWLSILSRGLIDRGHRVTVSCVRGVVSERLHELSIPTTNHRPRGSVDVFSALDFAAYLKSARPDALLMTSWRPTTWNVAAAKFAGIPRIVMRLGIVREFPTAGVRARALESVDALIVNSDEIRRRWLETKPDSASAQVHVVLNAIQPRIHERDEMKRRLRTELGLAGGIVLIGGAGHLAPRKGFDHLIRAFAAASLSDAILLIIGDGHHRANLEALAATLQVSDRVRFLGHRENGGSDIGGLDLFVLSSHNEGMANVMLEAMAAGTPVIAADISGVQTALGASSRTPAGWMYPPGDDNSMSTMIQTVVALIRTGSPEIVNRVAESQWRIENWFSTSRMIDQCEPILFPR
jgi:glycosyltransferase involved in cell wall biosynthesis